MPSDRPISCDSTIRDSMLRRNIGAAFSRRLHRSGGKFFFVICLCGEKGIQFGHHLKCIGNVENVGLAARPPAIRIKIHCSPFIDESPAHDVRFFTMATCGKSFGMARRRACLPDLVEVCHETQDCLIFTALIHERLASSEGRARVAQEFKNMRLRFRKMRCAVCLLLAPSCARNKKKLGIRTDGLRITAWSSHSSRRRFASPRR